MSNQQNIVKETKLYGHIVTAQDQGRKEFEGTQVGDAVIFCIAITDDRAVCFRINNFDIHVVTATEAGQGMFSGVKSGTIGVIDDSKFLSIADLNADLLKQSKLLEQQGEPIELSEEDLDMVVGGKIRWNANKFFRFIGSIVGGACTGGFAGVAVAVAIDVGVAKYSAISHCAEAARRGDWKTGIKKIKEDFASLLPFDI